MNAAHSYGWGVFDWRRGLQSYESGAKRQAAAVLEQGAAVEEKEMYLLEKALGDWDEQVWRPIEHTYLRLGERGVTSLAGALHRRLLSHRERAAECLEKLGAVARPAIRELALAAADRGRDVRDAALKALWTVAGQEFFKETMMLGRPPLDLPLLSQPPKKHELAQLQKWERAGENLIRFALCRGVEPPEGVSIPESARPSPEALVEQKEEVASAEARLIGRNLRVLRRRFDVTQSLLSEEIGVPDLLVKRWEDHGLAPNHPKIPAIVRYFQIEESWLFKEHPDEGFAPLKNNPLDWKPKQRAVRRICLRCEKRFKSRGPQHRICDRCRKLSRASDPFEGRYKTHSAKG